MALLFSSFGRPLASLLIALVLVWLLGLILLPRGSLVVRALQVEDRGGDAARLALDIERAYLFRFDIERRLSVIDRPVSAVTPSMTPSMTPSVTPSISPSSGGLPAGGSPGTGRPASGSGGNAGTVSSEDSRASLIEQLTAIDAAIAELEALESGSKGVDLHYSLGNFTSMSGLHWRIFIATLGYSLAVTVLAFVVCYPVAWTVATARTRNRAALLLLCLVIPYAINELLRIFAWIMILERQGLLNTLLDPLGLIDLASGEGIRFVASNGAVFAVMVYAYVLFVVFPIYNTMDTLDRNQVEAARDLGASTWRIHWRIVIPHAKPGIADGSIMTFVLSAGSIAVPEIVGRGMHPDWFSQVIYRRFFEADNWNQGAAYALALLVACTLFILAIMALFKAGIRDITR